MDKQKVKKVKCTLMQALGIHTGRTAHRGSRGLALLYHDHGTRRGWGVSVKPRPLFTPENDQVPIVQEAGWAPRPVWTGADNLAPTRIRSTDVQPVTSRYTDWATRPTRTRRDFLLLKLLVDEVVPQIERDETKKSGKLSLKNQVKYFLFCKTVFLYRIDTANGANVHFHV
jgi:hypothetical protein